MGFFSSVVDTVSDAVSDAGSFVGDLVTGDADLGWAGTVLAPQVFGIPGISGDGIGGIAAGGGYGQLAPIAGAGWAASSALPAAGATFAPGATIPGGSGVDSGIAGVAQGLANSTGQNVTAQNLIDDIIGPVSGIVGGPFAGIAGLGDSAGGGGILDTVLDIGGGFLNSDTLSNLISSSVPVGLRGLGLAAIADANNKAEQQLQELRGTQQLDQIGLQGQIADRQLSARLQTEATIAAANAKLQKRRLVQDAFRDLLNSSIQTRTGEGNALANIASLTGSALQR